LLHASYMQIFSILGNVENP